MKKGFTLIELLAVIVILAIIALIATPIILGIINNSREKANERSVELYANAVRNAIVTYQLNGDGIPKSFSELNVEKDGDIECATEILYSDGSFYLSDCTVNGTAVEYTYGTKQQVYKPQHYAFYLFGTIGSTEAPTTPLEVPPTGETCYQGYDVDSKNKISAAYLCFVRNGTEYCLKGGDEGAAYDTNNIILEDAFKDVENACSFDDGYSECDAEDMSADADSNGYVYVSNGDVRFDIYDYGEFD